MKRASGLDEESNGLSSRCKVSSAAAEVWL